GSPYTGWWFPSFHMVTNHHNIAGMLTETASAKMAWPLYIHPHQLSAHGRKHQVYGPMQLFPHPWEGGWWRLSDLIHQQHVSTYAMLETAANNRELLLRNMAFKAGRTIERGRTEPPHAFILPMTQHDPLTVRKLVRTLMMNGVEVQRAERDFVHEGRAFRAGDYIVSTAQPNGVLVRSLLGSARYPDDATTRRVDGTIRRPYDMANFVLAEHMGVDAVPATTPLDDDALALRTLDSPASPAGVVTDTAGPGWLVSHTANDAFRVTNRLLADGGELYWLEEAVEADGRRFEPGALWIPRDGSAATPPAVAALAAETGVDFVGVDEAPGGPAWRLRPLRMGLYRGASGNMDEGWTRLLLDRWGFPYERVRVDAIRDGALDGLDVFVFARESMDGLRAAGGDPRGTGAAEGEPEEYPDVFIPPEYRDGLDDAALDRLRDWVRAGGTLVLLDDASELAVEAFNVPVRDAVAALPDTAFFSPGSNLRARFDTSHPLAYGMPEEALILNWGSPVFRIDRTQLNERIRAPITYDDDPDRLLRSGWLIGGDRIAGLPAALDVEYGQGRLLLIGFRAQHRAQTHGTFKVFFNALYWGAAQRTELDAQVADG
ncbi:MAG: peptidase M14 family protein, partial [Gemmatimonadota bacterium]